MKKYIVVTGGAGFVGSNIIKRLTKISDYKIISIDNYSTGKIRNHVKHKNVKYIKSDTIKIAKILKSKCSHIKSIFHFGEFSRIYQSFLNYNQCFNSNILGTNSVINFCLKNNIKLIYSATSASLGKKQNKNLSPYAFSKSKNLELLENLKNWFNFKYEAIYFYNVYGKNQISKGNMATIIGIFEEQYKKKIPLTVVKPGTQTRKFTHINDTIDICIEAWMKNEARHYSISAKEIYSVLEIAKMFGGKIKYLPKRSGERYSSALTRMNLSNKVINRIGKSSIKNYISKFKKSLE